MPRSLGPVHEPIDRWQRYPFPHESEMLTGEFPEAADFRLIAKTNPYHVTIYYTSVWQKVADIFRSTRDNEGNALSFTMQAVQMTADLIGRELLGEIRQGMRRHNYTGNLSAALGVRAGGAPRDARGRFMSGNPDPNDVWMSLGLYNMSAIQPRSPLEAQHPAYYATPFFAPSGKPFSISKAGRIRVFAWAKYRGKSRAWAWAMVKAWRTKEGPLGDTQVVHGAMVNTRYSLQDRANNYATWAAQSIIREASESSGRSGGKTVHL